MVHMIQSVSHLLPNKFYTHLSPGIEQAFNKDYSLDRHADNAVAISCYKRLGFEPVASYNEYMVERK